MTTPCPESFRVQDFLDGELVPAEREAFVAHMAACADCAAQLEVYRVVFHRLASLPLLEPTPSLSDRVLAEILPSRPGRWVRALGWAYAATVGASLFAIAAAIVLPAPRTWTHGLVADATRSLVGSFMFVLKSVNATGLRLLDAFGGAGETAARLAAFRHAIATPLAQPLVVFTLWSAFLACALVLWWMRSREDHSSRGPDHVGMLAL